ncbi:MAG TPA: CHASE domain-containing protein [Alphaproteobacteria bacterium]|nr:CHASE domain-containing protein [Alphaproteobacteria bacterium]
MPAAHKRMANLGGYCSLVSVAAIGALGIAVAIGGFIAVRNAERERLRASFESHATEQIVALETSLSSTLGSLRALGGLHDAVGTVDRAAFNRFVSPLLAQDHTIQALEWAPRVGAAQRAELEASARQDWFPAFQFTERGDDGKMRRAAERSEYFPVYYVQPYTGNEPAFGFDLASSPPRRAALETAIRTGRMQATERIVLVQGSSDQYGMLVFLPVYNKHEIAADAEAHIRSAAGLMLGVFRIGDLVHRAIGRHGKAGGLVNLFVFDQSAPPGERLLYPKSSNVADARDVIAPVSVTEQLPVAGRQWQIVATPTAEFLSAEQRQLHWVVLIVGLAVTANFCVYSWVAMRRRAAVEQLVEERTAELRIARDTAEQATRARSDFLAVMSHEIRTPMNGVIGLADLLLESGLSSEQQRLGEKLRSSADHLLQIINDILDFAKLDADKMRFEEVRFELEQVVRSVIDIVAPQAHEKGLSLLSAIDPDLPHFFIGDPGRLRQILLNLVSNGVKFTKEGSVKIAVSGKESAVHGKAVLRFEVRDTGIGIPTTAIPSLFQEFAQVDGSISRRFGGTGLGLVISKKLVERMGGEIGAESEVGRGSVFHFTVVLQPVADLAAPTELAPRAEAAPGEPRMLNVLLAEDNPTNQMVAIGMLEKMGCRVELAVNGHAAVEAARDRVFDIILMDVMMPEMDGLAATRAIRSLPAPQSSVPIVAVTANAFARDAEECREAGMNDVLAKPFTQKSLSEMLAHHARAARGAGDAAESAPCPSVDLPPLFESGAVAQLLSDLGSEQVNRIYATFLEEIGARLDRMARQIAEGDLSSLEREAHSLKSSAAAFGFRRVQAIATAIEKSAKAGAVEPLGAKLDELATLVKESRRQADAVLCNPKEVPA